MRDLQFLKKQKNLKNKIKILHYNIDKLLNYISKLHL
jgi:hypothetical protein